MKPNGQAQRTYQYGNNNNKRKGNFGGQKNGKGLGSQSKKPNITYPRTTQENVAVGPTSVSSVAKKVTSPRIALLKWIKGQINLVYKDPD